MSCDLVGIANSTAYDANIPLNVSCEITLRCNIRCVHCYNFDRDRPVPPSGRELSVDEWIRVFDDLRRAGTLFVSLTGGEVFTHPRFFEILDATRERNFAVQILTNGTRVPDRLATYPNILGVGVSVYGATPETHDAVTQIPGSFRDTIANVAKLRDAGVQTTMKFIVLRRNHAEMDDMIRLAGSMKVPFVVDTTITGRYDGDNSSLNTRVTADELKTLYEGPLRPTLSSLDRDPGDEEWTCNCARGTAAITASGDVYPCIAVPWKAGNVLQQPFGDIWTHSPVFAKIRGLTLPDFKECSPCPYKKVCRRSNGAAYLHSGDYTSIDPWVCREAEVIAEVLGDDHVDAGPAGASSSAGR